MLQAALLDCQFFDLFPFSENGFVASEVDVCGCDVVQALVGALIVVLQGYSEQGMAGRYVDGQYRLEIWSLPRNGMSATTTDV